MENDHDEIDNKNIKKSSLNEYKVFQHFIASSTSLFSSTQISKNSLLNLKYNSDFESVSTLKDKIKRILNENYLIK